MHCRDSENMITQTMTLQLFCKELQDYTNEQQQRNENEREKCMLSGDIHKESTYYLLKGTRLKTIYSLRNCQLIIFW